MEISKAVMDLVVTNDTSERAVSKLSNNGLHSHSYHCHIKGVDLRYVICLCHNMSRTDADKDEAS